MKWLWRHRNSLLAICFSVARILFFFGAYRRWFWDVDIVRPGELETIVLNILMSLSIVAIAFGGWR